MTIARAILVGIIVMAAFAPNKAVAACDEFVGRIVTKHLAPAIENADCPVPTLDKKAHKLAGVCYESKGPTSHIKIDTQLNCRGSDESVVSKAFGARNALSLPENVTAEAEVRGADCQLIRVEVKPSGELGKVLAVLFDANGKARQALEQALTEVCKK